MSDAGGVFVTSFLTPSEYRAAFDEDAKAGRRLAYLAAYSHGGGPRISAIWTGKAPGGPARHGLSGAQYLRMTISAPADAHLLTREASPSAASFRCSALRASAVSSSCLAATSAWFRSSSAVTRSPEPLRRRSIRA